MNVPANQTASARSLGLALLIYVLLSILLITWVPFHFSWPRHFEFTWWMTPFDVLVNICLFIPVGFLFCTASRSPHSLWWRAVIFGVAMSCTIEAGQLFLAARYTSLWDVLWNGLGTLLGSLLHLRVASGLSRFLPNHPTFELPIMNLVYLSTIALWLNGLASVESPGRALLGPPLIVVCVFVFSAVWRYRLAAAFTRHQVTFGVLIWLVVAMMPTLLSGPFVVLGTALSAFVLTWYLTGRREDLGAKERRFELSTLRRTTLPFFIYLALLALWPLTGPFGRFDIDLHLSGLTDDVSIPQIFGVLEHHVAFTILGFMVAERRGRLVETHTTTVLWVLLSCTTIAVIFQVTRGFHDGMHASIIECVTLIVASVVGGFLYQTQLATLREWLARSASQRETMDIDELLDRFDGS